MSRSVCQEFLKCFPLPPDTSVVDLRSAYTYEALQNAYPIIPEPPRDQEVSVCRKLCAGLYGFFPIIGRLRMYEKSFLFSDMIAGLLVGFLHVPQGLAYSLLAGLPLISGIFTTLVPVIVYTIFGTSIHISMGTNSIVSLITADMVERELKIRNEELKGNASELHDSHAVDQFKLSIVMASAFVSGILFLAMGIFRLGFLTSYLPSSFVGGFTTAAGVHIGTTQVPKALHVKIKHPTGWGKVIQTYKSVFENIRNVNFVDLAIATCTFLIILLFSVIINPRLKSKIKFDIPINLIVVLIGTFVSFELSLTEEHGVATIGDIPDGFPKPVFPGTTMIQHVILDSVIMVLVTFSLNISMAILIGRIHHQEIRANQELIAYGMCNLLSSPFQCHVSSTSPARCMVLHNENAKSVFHSIPTIMMMVSVVLGLGHLLGYLPIAVLAAVVMYAIIGLLAQIRQLPTLWRVSKPDFAIWVSTFCVTTFVDIGVGLVFGISAAFAMVVITNQLVKGSLVVRADDEDVFIRGENRIGVHHLPKIRIFYFPAQLCYFNAELFKSQLFQQVLNPTDVEDVSYDIEDEFSDLVMVDRDPTIRCIILDCSAMSTIDMDGINMLKLLVVLYHKAAVQILLVRCLESVYNKLDRADFFSILPASCVFYDLVDALKFERYTREGVTMLTARSASMPHDFVVNINPPSLLEEDENYDVFYDF